VDSPPAAELLPYAVNDPALEAPWQREKRFRWLPSILLSVLALLLFDAAYLLSEAGILPPGFNDLADRFWAYWTFPICCAFLPLFVKRRGWLRLIVCVPLCSAVFLLFKPMDAANHPLDQNFWYAIICAVTVLVIAFCWHSSPRLGWTGFILACLSFAAMLGLIALLTLDLDYFWSGHWEWTLSPGNTEYIDAFLIRYAMLILLWLMLACLASKKIRQMRLAGVGLVFVVGAAVSLLVTSYFMDLRPRMIVYLMPTAPDDQQTRDYQYLCDHGISDAGLLLLLERASWEGHWVPLTPSSLHLPNDRNWRLLALDRLPRDAPTAQRLASILLSNPHLALAQVIGPRLGEAHAYRVAPVLLQFALFEQDEACIHALEMMPLPQVSWALLYQASPFDSHANSRLRNELPAVFGVDLASTAENWIAMVKAHGHGRRPLIPDAVCDQADAVLAQYQRYLDATDQLLIHIRRYPASAIVSVATPAADAIYVPQGRLSACIAANIKEPRCTTGSLEALTAEVDRYVADVDRFLHPPPATAKH
jgi:hypothetical protein